MNELADILTTVDRLTDGYQDAHWLQDDDSDKTAIVRMTRPGLLKQLRDSIVGGIGAHAGSSSPQTRMPIDAGALELYNSIETSITEWFVDATREPVHLELEKNLRQWYIAFRRLVEGGQVPPELERARLNTLDGWARAIEGKFNPPKTLELTVNEYEPVLDDDGAPEFNDADEPVWVMEKNPAGGMRRKVKARHLAECPLCGAQKAFDPKNGDQMPALILEFRDEGNDTLENATGLCRACEQVWRGGHGVRLLSWEVGQQEIALNTPTQSG